MYFVVHQKGLDIELDSLNVISLSKGEVFRDVNYIASVLQTRCGIRETFLLILTRYRETI